MINYFYNKRKENSKGDEGLKKPEIDAQAVIAQGAVVLGDVTVKKDASIWYNAVVRGDRSPVLIGEGSNIQDLCVLHVDENGPLTIGRKVTVGHGAILHACTIEDDALIGMGAMIVFILFCWILYGNAADGGSRKFSSVCGRGRYHRICPYDGCDLRVQWSGG